MKSLMTSAICVLASNFFYINEPVVNMRENPSNESKIVSQAIFSEEIIVKETTSDWSLINTPDGYTGWVLSNSFVNLSKPYDTSLKTSRLKTHIYGINDTEYGPIKSLPYGSKLKVLDSTDPRWLKIILLDGCQCYVQKGDVSSEFKRLHKNELSQFSQKFLDLPYTWGGRSSFGYDCSGFVQMLYHQIGIHLERDAKQQILDNRFQTIEIKDLEPGDLIFFGKSDQKITHVGMSIGDNQFIHATVQENKPWIRISSLLDLEWRGNESPSLPYRMARQLINK